MIQRKQTVFLFLAFLFTAICLCIPIGKFVPENMGVTQMEYNLWVNLGNGSNNLSVWPLFAILLIAGALSLMDIFLYNKRKLQAKICTVIILLYVLWYGIYAWLGHSVAVDLKSSFSISFGACLPLVALILTYLARRGIIADEKLVRSMDRIR